MGNQLSRDQLLAGPWDNDLDQYPGPTYQYKYIHSMSGYQCLIRRCPESWTYRAYIQLPSNHPDVDECEDILNDSIQVHGGLTYGHQGQFGFDCNHLLLGDLSPSEVTENRQAPKKSMSKYWIFDEVKRETDWLAQQFWLRAMEK